MLFNSYTFLLVFLPVVLVGWWGLRGSMLRFAFLTLASYVFYGWWDYRYVPMLMATTCVDYLAGRTIYRTEGARTRKWVLIGALTFNLALLGFFKYANFFVGSFSGLASDFGFSTGIHSLAIVLPIGISFYTFNSMSYTIDIYRRRVQPAGGFIQYSAFVAMFPHLVSGPIVRFSDIDQQLRAPFRRMTSEMASRGITLIVLGLASKLLVADRLAPHVDRLFSHAGDLGIVTAWSAAVGYSLQLFFDFSGYSNVAIGLALLLGFRFPQNFNSPFKAQNISDFWRRWHMSLSRWIRDYIFIPLGGSRGSTAQTARNLTVAMFLGGLWHGAGWTFVVWGLYHGVLLVGHATARARGLVPRSRVVARGLTFASVAAGFVIFRAPNLHVAGQVLGAMLGANGMDTGSNARALLGGAFPLFLVGLLVFVNLAPNAWELQRRLRPVPGYAFGSGLIGALVVLQLAHPSPFLYFKF